MSLKRIFLDKFISPITGRLASYEQLPELERGYIWIGHRHSNKAIPSLKVIDLRIDVNSLESRVKEIVTFPFDLPFVLKTPSNLVPNAQALSDLTEGIAKIMEDGTISIAVANTDYITPSYLTGELANYVLISAFPGMFLAEYSPAIAASLATYTLTTLPLELTAYNLSVILPETAAAISASLISYTITTLDPHIATAISGLNLNLTGDIVASGPLNTSVVTTFAPNPVFTGTTAITFPIGNTSQRDPSPTWGTARFNTDLICFEQYDGTGSWKPILKGIGKVTNQISILGDAAHPIIGLVDNPYLYGTGYLKIPSGPSAERPTEPYAGMIRFNTDLGHCEQYDGTDWIEDTFGTVTSISAGPGLAGGTITNNGTIYIPDNPVMPGTDSLTICRGTTAQRPTSPFGGMIRFNTETNIYEAYDGTDWKEDTFGTVTSVSGTSGQINSTGGNDPVLSLIVTGVSEGTYTNPIVSVDSYGRATAISSGDAPILDVQGTSNQIYVTPATQYPTVYLANNPIIPGNISITIPIGTTAQRSPSPLFGMFRANSTTNKLEYYDTSSWLTINSSNATVSSISITGSTGLSVIGSPVTDSGTIELILDNIPIDKLSNYPADSGKFLRGDGTWNNILTSNFEVQGQSTLNFTNISYGLNVASGGVYAGGSINGFVANNFAYFGLSGTSAVSGYYSETPPSGHLVSIQCQYGVSAVEFQATSSIKRKSILNNYSEIKDELKDKFDNLAFVKYEWKDKQKDGFGEYYGYIAENVAESFPELINADHMEYSPNILKFATIKKVGVKTYDISFKEDIEILISTKIKFSCLSHNEECCEEHHEGVICEQINYSTYRISSEKDIHIDCDIFVYGIYEKIPLVSKTRFHDMVAARLKILIDEVSELSQKLHLLETKK
jgi:hypothetical protein